jgi:type II secretory pathway component PulM
MTPDPDKFARRARALYLEASRQLDPSTAERLRAARRQALAAARPAPARFVSRLLLPAGAFAVLALATLMIWQPLRHADSAAPQAASATQAADADADLPPDADSADPQLYQNLDFYDWLATNDTTPPQH